MGVTGGSGRGESYGEGGSVNNLLRVLSRMNEALKGVI